MGWDAIALVTQMCPSALPEIMAQESHSGGVSLLLEL